MRVSYCVFDSVCTEQERSLGQAVRRAPRTATEVSCAGARLRSSPVVQICKRKHNPLQCQKMLKK